MIERTVKWFETRPTWKTVGGALSGAAIFYFAAYLSSWISDVSKLSGRMPLLVHAVTLVLLMAGLVIASRVLASAMDRKRREDATFVSAIDRAHALTDRLIMTECADLREPEAIQEARFVATMICSVETMRRLVNAAYDALEAAFGSASTIADRVDFEVTFMTKSYRDSLITIPAAANRDGTQPRSMILRQTNPRIYDASVTATVYAALKPGIVIVEDTSAEQYQELYAGQKRRIQSTVVYPVFSDASELLGTLVVHCNKAGFFRRGRERYWTEFLEVFSKRLALCKRRMDVLVGAATGNGTTSVALPRAPF